jgi:hypothetical protein
MSNTKEAAARHHPIAWGKSAKRGEARPERAAEVRHASGTRLQAAVPAEKKPTEAEPYADVPCTD